MEERRARQEKVVHREEMTATVGDVLEAEHVEEAIELLYRQDELAGKNAQASPPASAASQTATVEPARPEQRRDGGREAQSEGRRDDASRQQHAQQRERKPEPRRDMPAKERGRSALAFIAASFDAAAALLTGLRRAARDLREAGTRARRAFDT